VSIEAVVFMVDSVENYTFETQNEVQSVHWHNYHINILVHITYHNNPQLDPYDEESWVLTKYHFYISNDQKRDSKFVQHYFKLHWEHMVANGYAPKWHWVWSDGCASQIKSSKPWFFFSKYPIFTQGCKMLWSFFGSGHGKCLHDGARAIIKRFLQREQLDAHGEKLQNIEKVVDFLRKHLLDRFEASYIGVRRPLRQVFWLVKAKEVSRNSNSFNCDSIKGTMKNHSICATNKHNLTTLMVKDLACFFVHTS